MYEEWLAMGIDCDGCISGISPTVGFSNSVKEIVDVYEKRVNDLNCRTSRDEILNKNSNSIQYTVRISGTYQKPGTEDKLRFLKAILPFLIIKNARAEKAIKYLEKQLARKPKGLKDKFEDIMKPGLVYTTAELAKLQGIARFRAYSWLHRLSKMGVVKKMGQRESGYMHWMLAEEGDSSLKPEEQWNRHR